MSKALPGEHLCLEHQGNHSHYDQKNCTICKLVSLVEDAPAALNYGINKDAWLRRRGEALRAAGKV